MYLKRVRVIAFLLTFGISLPLLFFSYTWTFGFVLGGLASIAGFEILRFAASRAKVEHLKRSLLRARIVRMLVYAFSLIISLLLPAFFNFYSLFFGLFVIKLSIVVIQYFMKGFDSNEYFDG